jgi:hypothetical protein
MIELFLTRMVAGFAGHGLKIGLVVALAVMVATWDRSRINAAHDRGVASERASVEKRGEINARKADDARRSAERLPLDRLRDRHFRD